MLCQGEGREFALGVEHSGIGARSNTWVSVFRRVCRKPYWAAMATARLINKSWYVHIYICSFLFYRSTWFGTNRHPFFRFGLWYFVQRSYLYYYLLSTEIIILMIVNRAQLSLTDKNVVNIYIYISYITIIRVYFSNGFN